MKRVMTPATLILAALLASPAFAQDPRIRIFVGGIYFASSPRFAQTRTFTEFQEQGRIEGSFKREKGAGFEAGIQYGITPAIGVAAAFHTTNRRNEGSFSAELPHPFFFGQPRRVEATASLPFSEKAFHLDLVYMLPTSGPVGLSLFAGPSLFTVDASVIDAVSYASSFPFDAATVTGVRGLDSSQTGFGFNAGAGVDFRFNQTFGIGLRGRYSQATISPEGADADLKAGGFHIGGGLLLRF